MQSFDALLREAEIAHGHLCAGQVLGVRMAMLGCERLGINDPKGADRKRLVTFVEIDRCATDAIAVVTGCHLGKRALKFRDWGKMAATFVDLNEPLSFSRDAPVYKGVRIAALESSRQRARELYPHMENKNQQQMLAYSELPAAELFSEAWVSVRLPAREMPGYKSARILCERCGEGIHYDRQHEPEHHPESQRDQIHEQLQGEGSEACEEPAAQILCQGCASLETRYYQPLILPHTRSPGTRAPNKPRTTPAPSNPPDAARPAEKSILRRPTERRCPIRSRIESFEPEP